MRFVMLKPCLDVLLGGGTYLVLCKFGGGMYFAVFFLFGPFLSVETPERRVVRRGNPG